MDDLLFERGLVAATHSLAVDAGANEGDYVDILLRHGFEVHAYEPVPSVFSRLHARFLGDPKVECYQLGLSDQPDKLTGLQVLSTWSIGTPGQWGLETARDFVEEPLFDMTLVTLDQVSEEPVGFLKLDVDGYEFKVLRGAEKTLRQWRPPVWCEFSCFINQQGQNPEEFMNFIFSLGYEVHANNQVYRIWSEMSPDWPYHSSYDVLLLPT